MASRNQRKKRNKRNGGSPRSGTANTRHEGHGSHDEQGVHDRDGSDGHARRTSTETKSALRTTELVAFAATVLAIVIASLALDADGDGGTDPFGAEQALRYITYLTIGYMVARGLAKAGSWSTHARRGVTRSTHATPAAESDENDHAHEDDHAHGADRAHEAGHDHESHHRAGHVGTRDDGDQGPHGDHVTPATAVEHVEHPSAASVDVEDVVDVRHAGDGVAAGVSPGTPPAAGPGGARP